jgi:AcrR family transcriptional regulator
MGIQDRRQRHKESLRRQILDAARDVFINEGYRNASMRKIAQKIEYSPATIYSYFQDKSELLDALLEETFAKLGRKLQQIFDQETDGLDGLRKGLRAYIDFGIEHPNHYILVFVLDESYFGSERATHKLKYGLQCFDNLRQSVLRAKRDGGLKDGDPEAICQALWAGAHGVTSLLIAQPGFPFVGREALIERTLDALFHGVVKTKDSTRKSK